MDIESLLFAGIDTDNRNKKELTGNRQRTPWQTPLFFYFDVNLHPKKQDVKTLFQIIDYFFIFLSMLREVLLGLPY